MQRFRITYAKTHKLRYTGNLDIHKIWERTIRRTGLALAYSQGFHPQPRLHQASPLPLGMTSRCEMVDLWLTDDAPIMSPEQIQQALGEKAPAGLELLNVEVIKLDAPALQTQIAAAEYNVTFLDKIDPAALHDSTKMILTQSTLIRERRGKNYDLRPLILNLQLPQNDPPLLTMQLSACENATGRADEVLLALNIEPALTRIERTNLIFKNG
jgi:radical SAM-linked protein